MIWEVSLTTEQLDLLLLILREVEDLHSEDGHVLPSTLIHSLRVDIERQVGR